MKMNSTIYTIHKSRTDHSPNLNQLLTKTIWVIQNTTTDHGPNLKQYTTTKIWSIQKCGTPSCPNLNSILNIKQSKNALIIILIHNPYN